MSVPLLLVKPPAAGVTPGPTPSTLISAPGITLTLTVQMAFGNNPGDLDTSLSWTDVTKYVRAFSIKRGRQYELNRIEAGTCDLTVKNLDRRFDPANTAGPYYPNVQPMVPVRVQLTLNGVLYNKFRGFVERWPQTRTGPSYAEVVVNCVDGSELLTQAILPGATYPQELSGSRIGRVLDAVGWSPSARNLSAGQSQITSFTFATLDGNAAKDHIDNVVESEIGQFFIDGTGTARFLDRHASIGTTSQATFSDEPVVDAGSVGYSDIVSSLDKDLITNDWVGTRSGGVTQEALDSNSIRSYFRRSQTRSPLLTSDAEVMESMQFLLSQYKTPSLRVESVTVTPGATALQWTHVLARELGDRVTVREHPPGGGSPIVQDSFIEQIDLSVDRHAASAKMTWGLTPAVVLGFWAASYSQAGIDTRAGY